MVATSLWRWREFEKQPLWMRSWQTSQHGCGSHWSKMGFPLRPTGRGERKERAEDLGSSQNVRDHLVAYHLVPAISDIILDENWECCNNEFEQTLMLLHNEWSKEIEPSRQNSTHHPLIVSNPIDKKHSEFVRRSMPSGKRPRYQRLHMTLAPFVSKKRH